EGELDVIPRMQLVDAVDTDADNRAELIFELAGKTDRQFAIYRVHDRAVQQVSSDVLRIQQGSLYPALHRLERRGWIKARWGTSENNRRAKYYELTRA